MAIYKPSNLGPNLEEIDVSLTIPPDWGNLAVNQDTLDTSWQSNIFEAQVNTTGENVLAYRINILENNTEDVIYDSGIIELPKKSTNYFGKPGVKNKDFVKTYYMNKEEYTSNRNFIINSQLSSDLKNGKDYQWNIRMYDAPEGSTAQPITKVCDGFLVGSTKYVLWGRWTQEQNDLLLYDRYIEITPRPNNVFPIIGSNEDNIQPPTNSTEPERIQIDWVEKELGNNKDITKIELMDGLIYNYRDGAKITVYLCDDNHTLNSAYADPNSSIDVSMFMVRYVSRPASVPVKYTADTLPVDNANATSGVIDVRRIIGTSTVTGELRVQEPFCRVPKNGEYYVLYQLDRINNEYNIVEGQGIYSSGQTSANINNEKAKAYNQKIGGNPQGSPMKIITNVWNDNIKRLFIQPNINIKSDKTNPNEIVFDVNGVRVDILQYINKDKKDWTFNKLDNTQWLLENESGITRMSAVTSNGEPITNKTTETVAPTVNTKEVPIIPGSIYTVYTDFMDSMPNGVFYARKTPTITMMYHNLNSDGGPTDNFEPIQNATSRPWRDIEFKAEWDSPNNTQVKYYRYTLFDENGNQIAQSEDLYDSDLYWSFRGFRTDDKEPETTPVNYTIELLIIDELNKEFLTRKAFNILYTTVRAEAPLEVEYDCDKQAFKITAESPLYAIQSDTLDYGQVELSSLDAKKGTVDIPINKVMNYDKVLAVGYPNITLTKPMYYLTQFRINKTFVKAIPPGGERIVTEIVCQKDANNVEAGYDKYTLKLSSIINYFIDEVNNIIIKNNDKLKLRWYKNDSIEPLKCFKNGTSDNFDLIHEDPDQTESGEAGELAYALQPSKGNNRGEKHEYYYQVGESFPTSGVLSNVRFFLTKDYIYNGKVYQKGGTYKWLAQDKDWEEIPGKEFLFVESLSQIPGYNFDDFYVPLNCRDKDGETILYGDGTIKSGQLEIDSYNSTVWLDNLSDASDTMENILASKWLTLFLKIDETATGEEKVDSQITISRERM